MMRDNVRPKVTFCLTRWPAKAISRLIADRGALSSPPAMWLVSPLGLLRNCISLRCRDSKMGARQTEANPRKTQADTAARTPVGVTPVTFRSIGLAKDVTGGRPVPKRSSLLGYTTLLMLRQRSGSVLCYACGKLNRADASVCFYCGTRWPGLWGFGPLLGRVVGRLDMARL